jgi:hypothetical protein
MGMTTFESFMDLLCDGNVHAITGGLVREMNTMSIEGAERRMGLCELQQILHDAPGRLLLRFDVEMADSTPMWRPVAWRPVSAERWQRFDNAPWFPQTDVYAAVRVTGGQMERECHGAGRELVYWYQKAA